MTFINPLRGQILPMLLGVLRVQRAFTRDPKKRLDSSAAEQVVDASNKFDRYYKKIVFWCQEKRVSDHSVFSLHTNNPMIYAQQILE